MLPVGFEPAFPTSERQKTHDLDCAVTGLGSRAARFGFITHHQAQIKICEENLTLQHFVTKPNESPRL
jgi:hypothetical protein